MISKGTNVGSVVIDIKGDGSKFTAAMAAADAQARRAGASMQTALAKADTEAKKLGNSLFTVQGAFATIGGLTLAKELADTADAFSLMRSRIRLVTQAGEDMLQIERDLTEQALRNRAALKPTIDLYTRLRQSRKDLTDAATQELVDRWSKSLIISASSAQEAASSTLQFSQAMAAGVLQGQELRSVIQGNSAFAVYLAEGLGITTGELKAMGETGEISLNKILAAMKKVGDHIDHDFSKKALTIHQAFINLETSVTRFIGLADQGAGASAELAKWINVVAANFDTVAKFAIAAGQSIAGALAVGLVIQFAGQMKNLAVSIRAAASAAVVMRTAMGFLLGPWGIALGAIIAGLTALNSGLVDTRTTAQKAADAMEDARKELEKTDGIVGKLDLSKAADQFDAMQVSAKAALTEIDAFNKAMEASGAAAKTAAYLDVQKQITSISAAAKALEADLAAVEKVFVERGNSFEAPRLTGSARTAAQAQLAELKALEAQLRARAEAIQQTPDAVFKPKDDNPAATTPAAATAKSITQLTGYYTELEKLEQSLADIRAAEAEGATGASRAALQAMLDYYEATDDTITVLRTMRELQGDILSDADASLLDDLITKLEDSKVTERFAELLANANPLPAMADEYTYSGQEAQKRLQETIAYATKYGLIQGIETGDWGEAFAQILGDSVREALSNAIDVLFEALNGIDWGQLFGGSSSGTGWEGLFNAVGGFFQPKASGGPVSAGGVYRVGEMGSEWFIPRQDGYIVPHGAGKALSGMPAITIGGTQVIVNGNADSATRAEIAALLDANNRALPGVIQSVVNDRRVREGW